MARNKVHWGSQPTAGGFDLGRLAQLAAGGGAFVTGPLSPHTRTSLEVIKLFLAVQPEVAELAEGKVLVRIPARA